MRFPGNFEARNTVNTWFLGRVSGPVSAAGRLVVVVAGADA